MFPPRFWQSNTILSSSSSLFTFLASLVVLGEKFTCLKLVSVLLCMVGTIIVSLGDSKARTSSRASKPILGDILSLLAAALYAIYVTLIRKKFPDEESGEGKVSMAQFLGFVGLFNLFIFLPVALVLNFTRIEPFHMLSLKQLSLIVGKGQYLNLKWHEDELHFFSFVFVFCLKLFFFTFISTLFRYLFILCVSCFK